MVTEGSSGELPEFNWTKAPAGLGTLTQLSKANRRPGGPTKAYLVNPDGRRVPLYSLADAASAGGVPGVHAVSAIIVAGVRDTFSGPITVQGEVTGCYAPEEPATYFSFDLVEELDGHVALLQVFLSRQECERVSEGLAAGHVHPRDLLVDGQQVVVGGRLDYDPHPKRGIRLLMESLDPQATEGLLEQGMPVATERKLEWVTGCQWPCKSIHWWPEPGTHWWPSLEVLTQV